MEIEDLNHIDDSTNQTGIELCDEPQKKAEARPTCKGNLTFINDYKWKKLWVSVYLSSYLKKLFEYF